LALAGRHALADTQDQAYLTATVIPAVIALSLVVRTCWRQSADDRLFTAGGEGQDGQSDQC
jgi:hypothetical protein